MSEPETAAGRALLALATNRQVPDHATATVTLAELSRCPCGEPSDVGTPSPWSASAAIAKKGVA